MRARATNFAVISSPRVSWMVRARVRCTSRQWRCAPEHDLGTQQTAPNRGHYDAAYAGEAWKAGQKTRDFGTGNRRWLATRIREGCQPHWHPRTALAADAAPVDVAHPGLSEDARTLLAAVCRIISASCPVNTSIDRERLAHFSSQVGFSCVLTRRSRQKTAYVKTTWHKKRRV